MALVADSRAFGVNRRRTTYRQVAWTRNDRIALAGAVLLVIGTGVVILSGGGRF